MVEIRISFDSSTKTYRPGQIIRLKITLNTTQKFKARCVSVQFIGHGENSWFQSQVGRNKIGRTRSRSVRLVGREEYLRRYCDLDGIKGGPEFQVDAGSRVYRTECHLPNSLPSSYNHEYGWIRYEVRVNVERAWSLNDDHKEIFKVISCVDLNEFPQLREPHQQSKSKNLGKKFWSCCCNEFDPVTLTLKLPKAGFLQTEPVPVVLEISNESQVDVSEVKAKILQQLTFRVKEPYKDIRWKKRKLAEFIFDGNVKRLQKKIFCGQLIIPSDHVVINTNGCTLVENKYYLIATVKFGLLISALEIDKSITIGTVGFAPSEPTQGTTMVIESAPVMEPLPSYNEVVTLPNASPPPSFEDATTDPPSFEEIQN